MMTKNCQILVIGMLALGLTGCQEAGQKQTLGTLLGAVTGAVAGAQVGKGRGQLAAVAAGTLLGSLLGGNIGKSLDNADRIAMRQTTQRTLETSPAGKTVRWKNPDSGHSGTVTPQLAKKNTAGQYCREYQQTITVNGKTEAAYGRACRQPDGSWKIVSG